MGSGLVFGDRKLAPGSWHLKFVILGKCRPIKVEQAQLDRGFDLGRSIVEMEKPSKIGLFPKS